MEINNFINCLGKKGYKFIPPDTFCEHENDNVELVIQRCSCCYRMDNPDLDKTKVTYRDLEWYLLSGCEECLFDEIRSYDCGGHYTNFMVFIDGKHRKEYDLRTYDDIDENENPYQDDIDEENEDE